MPEHIHHDPDAERAVLGAVATYGADAAADAMCLLRESDFWSEQRRAGWRVVCALFESGQRIDEMSILMQARQMGLLDAIGGPASIPDWQMASRGKTAMAQDIVRLRRSSTMRSVQAALKRAYHTISKPGADAEAALDEVTQAVFDAVSDDADREAPQGFSEIAKKALQAFKEANDARGRGETLGVPTGIASLDRAMGGMRAGKYIVIGARPGQGKTAMAQCFLAHAMQQGHPVALYSMEMDEVDTAARFLSLTAGVPFGSLISGDMAAREWDALYDAVERTKGWALTFRSLSAPTPERLLRMARADVHRRKVKVIAIDYLQLVRGGPRDSPVDVVSKASLACKQIAKELDVCVLALAQLNRTAGTEPSLVDLKQSGQIEQDANVVIFPYQDDHGNRQLKFGKFREGNPSLKIPLEWRGDLMRFTEAAQGAGPGLDMDAHTPYGVDCGDDDLPI